MILGGVGECIIPGSAEGQAGWSSGQPGLVRGVCTHGKGLELDVL